MECPVSPPDTLRVLVTETATLEVLLANAATLEQRQDFAGSALVYNEVLVRSQEHDEAEAEQARVKALELMAGYLGVEKGLTADPLQGERLVASPEFVAAIRQFQERLGIPETGKLDYLTLSGAAEAHISAYLFSVIRDGEIRW